MLLSSTHIDQYCGCPQASEASPGSAFEGEAATGVKIPHAAWSQTFLFVMPLCVGSVSSFALRHECLEAIYIFLSININKLKSHKS